MIYFILTLSLFTSCFRDTGNYDYEELDPPTWLSSDVASFAGYSGHKIRIHGSKLFVWPKDSATRAQEVRYEWVVNGKVISEELDFEMPVDELMKQAGIKDFNLTRSDNGVFRVIEKGSGVSFPKIFNLWLYPYYANGDWTVLVDKGGKASLSTLRRRNVGGKRTFFLKNDAFEEHNDNKKLEGKPLELTWSYARHIGVTGAYTVLTDKANYVIASDNLKLVGDLKDEFLDGVPAGFQPVSRADIDVLGDDGRPVTFLANKDGKVYTRVMGANYLGGKFLTEAYELDEKGYEVSLFGSSRLGSNFLCYDKKNHRILYASQFIERLSAGDGTMNQIPVYRTRLTPLADTPYFPLSDLGDNIEIVGIRSTSHYPRMYFNYVVRQLEVMFTIFYNRKDDPDHTYTADIAVHNQRVTARDLPYKSGIQIPRIKPGDNLLTTGNIRSERSAQNARMMVMVTRADDNSIWYYTHDNNWMSRSIRAEKLNVELPAKITSIEYDYIDCGWLMIGCENGDILLYDIEVISQPTLLFKGNVGGKPLSFRGVGMRTVSHDR